MKKMKLNALENQSLNNKEMNAVRGGDGCGCGCNYAGTEGGSSTSDNASANNAGGLTSPGYTAPTLSWTSDSGSGGSSNPPAQSSGGYTVSY
jgi:natural product precursor